MKRTFSSYGPVTNSNYHAPRTALIDKAHKQLVGENPDEGGHYFTVWAPRQCGKSWTFIQVLSRLQKDERFYAAKINMETVKGLDDITITYSYFVESLNSAFNMELPIPETRKQLQDIFTRANFDKPLILILDEFDALEEPIINDLVSIFRDIFQKRKDETNVSAFEKKYVIHGIALIGVRSVLGIENVKGSPFNVQRSLHIPNLTFEEVQGMFRDYMEETGQQIEPEVIEKLYYETQGQPGLVSWFGELLTEQYNEHPDQPITMYQWNGVYSAAMSILPNNTIMNLISKAKDENYRSTVIGIFQTNKKTVFKFDDTELNYLYMNGVIDYETQIGENGKKGYYARFSCPFVQKRLFNYFSDEVFPETGKLMDPFDDLSDAILDTGINFRNLIKRYEAYLKTNRDWLFRDVPRRTDMRIRESVFHFNIYRYLTNLLDSWKIQVVPEFPTGNGKIDLLLRYNKQLIGLELKSYRDKKQYESAIAQAASYGKQLGLTEMNLLFFIEAIDDQNREKYGVDLMDKETGVLVKVVFVETGN